MPVLIPPLATYDGTSKSALKNSGGYKPARVALVVVGLVGELICGAALSTVKLFVLAILHTNCY